ncbi:putative PIN family toxin of toxin-antitoxin system [Duganella sp. BK701]|uniref:putative toxin-antitoxin system toxin component, PIN family n=1 Tax=unclassified Duganella TaxID=2636909 RepID=UPI001028C658|nr:putative PIN family toxin of toxin-antitoxin system [Duganella sp. BK701]
MPRNWDCCNRKKSSKSCAQKSAGYGYRHLAFQVSLPAIIPKVSRDPKDDVVLACALQSHTDAIVSGDRDLLSLKQYQNIPIVTSTQALNGLP